MPLGFGCAVSHSPLFYRPRESWEEIYGKLTAGTPQDTRAAVETPDVLDEYAQRPPSPDGKPYALFTALHEDPTRDA